MSECAERPGGRNRAPDSERVWTEVAEAAEDMCAPEADRARLRASVATATERAFEPCLRRDCAACDRYWEDTGLPCGERQAHKLGKQLLQFFLPVLRRGWVLAKALPVLTGAAARALAREAPPRRPGSAP